MDCNPQAKLPLDWHIAARPMNGQPVSGDLHLVKPFDHGVLLAVVDGVGHGDEATAAARTAVAILEKHASASVVNLMQRCHDALKSTRGVVMTVVSLNTATRTLTWLGVGNVEGRLLREDAHARHPAESVLLRGGLVGLQLPMLQASTLSVAPGDLLVLATDGIAHGFDRQIQRQETPRQIAEGILQRHFKGVDDALVLVARMAGDSHE